ncbi:MAG: phosphoribosyl-AMP cyclohydrolase [Candidatus Omnitrophica bacterium CG1_02_49_10]|nr:MAG: phosphoribosyl-AMP cyclohydrolase [Candidatus Omnitrophica bacterium CG1_02_49_10]
MSSFIESVKFDGNGLVPVIVQDYKDKVILMQAYMNRESLELTLKTKKAHFYSRSRKKLWLKGETSGNIQKAKAVYLDCDGDSLVVSVEQIGGAACHTGYRSCFYRKVHNGKLKITGKRVFDPKKVYGR